MAYRNDLEALAARHAALDAEIAERTRERDEAARLLAEARDVTTAPPPRPPARREQSVAMAVGIAVVVAMCAAIGLSMLRRPSAAEAMLAQYERFTSEACACTTRACADDVLRRLQVWSTRADAPKPDATHVRRLEDMTRRLSACVDRTFDRVEVDEYPPR